MTYILASESTDYLTLLLHLPATGQEQDWDIELADYSRLSEFLRSAPNVTLTEDRRAFVALLIASYDDLIASGLSETLLWDQIVRIISSDPHIYSDILKYWACEDAEAKDAEFGVSSRIRELQHRFSD